MKYSVYLTLVSLLFINLAGCAYQPPKDISSSFYSPPVGSQLQLHKTLTIPANDTQVRIQDGKVISSSWDLDAYYPNCNFELHKRAEVARTIQPDIFIISRVVRDTENVMLHSPIIVARSSGNGAPSVDYITIMDLSSPRQPEVMRLTCQHWEDPSDSYHLSIKQIRKTLGELFTLTLADG
ncbi:MAG: hypothetical protein KAT25_00665 [Sulfuriflexus sp.]|nr:hypothetical protein [Sulfuriflexus sp.]